METNSSQAEKDIINPHTKLKVNKKSGIYDMELPGIPPIFSLFRVPKTSAMTGS
jgi:hypothetical protein